MLNPAGKFRAKLHSNVVSLLGHRGKARRKVTLRISQKSHQTPVNHGTVLPCWKLDNDVCGGDRANDVKDADDVDANNGDSVDAADGGVGADDSVDMLIELTG